VRDWQPTTATEVAMRDALRVHDQERYFGLLARSDLLLPVSADALTGRTVGWGTWTTDGRTHLLAFTSTEALYACLADHGGSYRTLAFEDLAAAWPNMEWWLAVNPGLPIEAYLPAWYVTQVKRGDIRLPGRTLGARARIEHANSLRARAVAQVPPHNAPASPSTGPVQPASIARHGPRLDQSTSVPPRTPRHRSAPEPDPVLAPSQRAVPPALPAGPPWPPGREAPPPITPRRDAPPFPERPPVARPPEPPPLARPSDALPVARPPDAPVAVDRGRASVEASRPPAAGATTPAQDPRPLEHPRTASRAHLAFQPRTELRGEARGAVPFGEARGTVPSGGAPGAVQRGEARGTAPAPPPAVPARTAPPEPAPPAPRRADVTAFDGFARRSADPLTTPDPLTAPGPVLPPAPLPAPPVPAPAVPGPAVAGPAEASVRAEPRHAAAPPPIAPPEPPAPADVVAQDIPPAFRPGRLARASQPVARGVVAGPRIAPERPADPAPVPPPAPVDIPEPERKPTEDRWAALRELVADRSYTWAAPEFLSRLSELEPADVTDDERDEDPDLVTQPVRNPPIEPEPETLNEPEQPSDPVQRSEPERPSEPKPSEPEQSSDPAADEPRLSDTEAVDFVAANPVEESLLTAAQAGSTENFLSTLLLAKVLLPGPAADTDPFADVDHWHTEEVDGAPYLVVFTSEALLTRHLHAGAPAVWIKFTQLIRAWPDEGLAFSVNPGTPVGATLPGPQIMALANWANEVGLSDERPEPEPAPQPEPERRRRTVAPPPPAGPVVMQKAIAAAQAPFYLERGYDRVSGFVHRASEVAHLRSPAELYGALGLDFSGSQFKPDDDEVYLLRWPAYRGNLYRIPYGGQHEAGMRAMQGWVIERAPFRGNGFAPSEGRDVVAEFKVDSTRLPHGAQLWRLGRDGEEKLVALFDADGPRWRRVSPA
jgi:hypothetical protein